MKFTDILKFQNCLFIYQVKQNDALAASFPALHSKDKHNYQTRSVTQNLLHVPLARTNKYDKESLKYQCIRDWNNFKKKFPQIREKKLSNMEIKRILKQAIFDQYWMFHSPPSTSTCALCTIYTLYLPGLIQLITYFMILLLFIFIVNWNFKLLSWHIILFLLSFVLLPFPFCIYYYYYYY